MSFTPSSACLPVSLSHTPLPISLTRASIFLLHSSAAGWPLHRTGPTGAVRIGANLSPEPVSNWVLSLVEDVIAFVGTLLAVFAPFIIMAILGIFVLAFIWFFPKIFRAVMRMIRAVRGIFSRREFS